MTKKTVKKNARGNTVDLQTFLTTSSVDGSWAEEMEGEPTTTTPTNAASTTSTGLTLEELRANSDVSHGGNRFNNNSGFGHRENNYSRELGNNVTAKVKPSSFYSEGAPQKSSSGGFNSESSFERRERRPQQQNELPTERPFVAFIGNLSFNATKDDLAEFFGDSPINISLPKDKETQRPKGYGYVEFDSVEDLKLAITLNGNDFMGRSIKIDIASPETAAKVTIDNRDSFRGGNRRDGGFRRNDNFERSEPQSVADKSDNWRTGGDLDINPFGNKKNNNNNVNANRKPRENNSGSGAFGSFSSKPRYDDSKPAQKSSKPSLFGEGKPWEPKEKDLKALEPNLDILSSKKKAPQTKKEGESQEGGDFQTATSKPRGGKRYQQSSRGGFSNNTNNTKKATSSKKSEEEQEQQDLESKNQYAALSEQ